MQAKEIYILYGENIKEMTQKILEKTDLAALIPRKDSHIGIKPNFVVAKTADKGATTHPEIICGVVEYLQANGFYKIEIIEGAWVGEKTKNVFKINNLEKMAKKYDLILTDTQKDRHKKCDCAGLACEISERALQVDFMINIPVLKGHCQTKMTCALKNNKGILSNASKREFHAKGLDKPIAQLNTVAKNDYILVDNICGDLDFEEGGNPLQTGRLLAARDPVLCDAYCATLMGYAPETIKYIPYASALGVGDDDVNKAKIIEINASLNSGNSIKNPSKIRPLTKYVKEEGACSACYASLMRALSQIEKNKLERLKEPICIGQGFQGQKGIWGVGKCTAHFKHSIPGCPPNPQGIIQYLDNPDNLE